MAEESQSNSQEAEPQDRPESKIAKTARSVVDTLLDQDACADVVRKMISDFNAERSKPTPNKEESEAHSESTIQKSARSVVDTLLDHAACEAVVRKMISNFNVRVREKLEARSLEPPKPFQPIEHFRKATPCNSQWETMTGAGRVRFCEQCKLQAYDFSNMQLPEAEELIFKQENKEIVQFYKRRDSKFLTQDCPVGVRRKRTKIIIATVAGSLGVGVIALLCLLPKPATPTYSQNDQDASNRDEAGSRSLSGSPSNTGGGTRQGTGQRRFEKSQGAVDDAPIDIDVADSPPTADVLADHRQAPRGSRYQEAEELLRQNIANNVYNHGRNSIQKTLPAPVASSSPPSKPAAGAGEADQGQTSVPTSQETTGSTSQNSPEP